jgi:hypothetical protein
MRKMVFCFCHRPSLPSATQVCIRGSRSEGEEAGGGVRRVSQMLMWVKVVGKTERRKIVLGKWETCVKSGEEARKGSGRVKLVGGCGPM